MSRPYLDVIGQGQKGIPQALKQLRCADKAGVGRSGRLVEEVGTPQVADEHEIAREQHGWFRRARAVDDQEAEMLWCVAGGVERPQGDVAQADLTAVAQPLMGKGILPLVVPFIAQVQRGLRLGC